MSKILKYLSLDKVGFLEILLALFPILAAYRYGFIYVTHIVLLVLDIVIVFRGKTKLLKFTPLLLFFIYYVLHCIAGFTFFGLRQSYYINLIISNLIYLISLFIIIPTVNFEKFEGSINWVSLICVIGLFYHAVLVAQGRAIDPIKLPFLPAPDLSETRLFGEGARPKSFFVEPQAYVSFILYTLFYAVRKQKYFWAILVGLSIILSTSTTGLAMIPVMISVFVFMGRSKWYSKILMITVLVGLVFFLFRSDSASYGLEKMQNTEINENARTSNGPNLAAAMEYADMIFGVPYATATDFYLSSVNLIDKVVLNSRDTVFLPGFWQVFIFYGIVGVFLYLLIYWKIWRINRDIAPLMACLIVGMFTNPDFIGPGWFFSIVFLLSFVNIRNHCCPLKKQYRSLK